MNILNAFVLFAIILKCVAASEEDVGAAFKKAVDGENFEWLKESYRSWENRKDLLDDVIGRGFDVTIQFIQNVKNAKECVLAALFDQGEDMVDGVLGGINYNDDDLWRLTNYRPELAVSREKLFRVLGKIKGPKVEDALRLGVSNLFRVQRHDLVAPLVNALGKRLFNGRI